MTAQLLALVLLVSAASAACGRIGFDGIAVDAEVAASQSELRSLCRFDKVTVIENGISVDDDAAARMRTALAAGCGNSPLVREVSQDEPGVLDPVTDRPLIPTDELAIIGGGDGPNRAIAYLLASGATSLVWQGPPVFIHERATGRLVASGPANATHDFAILLLIVDPTSGLSVLSCQGMVSEGTEAAGMWFARIAPQIASNTAGWSVVEWTDTDGVAGPTDDDAFVEIESGR